MSGHIVAIILMSLILIGIVSEIKRHDDNE